MENEINILMAHEKLRELESMNVRALANVSSFSPFIIIIICLIFIAG